MQKNPFFDLLDVARTMMTTIIMTAIAKVIGQYSRSWSSKVERKERKVIGMIRFWRNARPNKIRNRRN